VVNRRLELPRLRAEWIVRSTALNFAAVLAPGLVGIVVIPIAIHGLGGERYGVLSLALVAMSYISLFDLGLGRATTKHVSAMLADSELVDLGAFAWTAVLLQLVLAVCGAIALALATPYLTDSVFHVPPYLSDESRRLLGWLSASLVPVLLASLFRGLLEAARRFDLVNAVKAPSITVVLAIPAIVTLVHGDLGSIGLLVFIAQGFTAISYAYLVFTIVPILSLRPSFRQRAARLLMSYGGWVTAYSVLTVVLSSLDRLILGNNLSLSELPYYTAPLDALMRLQVIPATIGLTLFPIFSVNKLSSFKDSSTTYSSSLRITAFLMGITCLVLLIFSEDILKLWLGQDFASHSLVAFQILTVAILVNSLAWLPSTFTLGANRPDIVAKLFGLDLLVYLPTLWFLVAAAGINGAALAVLARSCVELVLFFALPSRAVQFPRDAHSIRRLAPLATFGLGASIAAPLISGLSSWSDVPVIQALLRAVILVILGLFAWQYVLLREDRGHAWQLVEHVFRPMRLRGSAGGG
jgi:O-antigen/teichoic acid export membrane protein